MFKPQRIASLLSSATEMLYALGADEQLVAVSHECDYPPPALAKPRATFTNIAVGAPSIEIDRQVKQLLAGGRPLYEIDAELLVRLQPDLIVTQAQCDVCAIRYDDVLALIEREPSLAATRVVALNPQSLGDVLADIQRLGAAIGREKEAATYVEGLRSRIDAVRRVTGLLPTEQRRRGACIEWIEPLMIAGNWTPELIELAGGTQTFAEAGRHSTYTSWDAVQQFDPEVIVIMPCGFDLPRTILEAARLREIAGWHDLAAVRTGRVYAVDGNALFNRSGPRLVDSLELLARLIHPELHDENALESRRAGSVSFRIEP